VRWQLPLRFDLLTIRFHFIQHLVFRTWRRIISLPNVELHGEISMQCDRPDRWIRKKFPLIISFAHFAGSRVSPRELRPLWFSFLAWAALISPGPYAQGLNCRGQVG
jgi:hypothetical protein